MPNAGLDLETNFFRLACSTSSTPPPTEQSWVAVTVEWSHVRGHDKTVKCLALRHFCFFFHIEGCFPWAHDHFSALLLCFPSSLLNNIPAIVGWKYRTCPEVDVDTSAQAFFSLKLAWHREAHEWSRQHINVLEQIPSVNVGRMISEH